MCTTDFGERVQVWADVKSSIRPRDITNADRAVMWLLDPPDSPVGTSDSRVSTEATLAHIISHGVARVSLEDLDGSMEATRGLWLPTDFRVLPNPERNPQMSIKINISATSTSTSSSKTDEYRRVVLSTVLAEALGLDVCSACVVRLSVRKLECIGVATALEVRGPFALSASCESDQNACLSGFVPTMREGQLPTSIVNAVSSVLPDVLEGEVVSRGSIIGIVGMFKVVVDAAWYSPVEEEGTKLCDAVLRIGSTTELRFSSSQTGSLQDSHLANTREVGGSGQIASHPQYIKSQPTARPGEELKYHTAGQGMGDIESSSCVAGPPLLVGVSSVVGAVLVPRDVDQWLRLVQRDFGGERAEVVRAVHVARAALEAGGRRSKGGSWLDAHAGGLLLHGATGTGKTLLARSLARHSGAPWFFLDCSSVFRKNRGEAEQLVQELLDEAEICSPSVVVLDQLDTVCRKRHEVAGITELQIFSILSEVMDHCRTPSGPNIFFVATCTDATVLDPSLLQRGRLEVILRLGSLDASSRASILLIHARDMPLRLGTGEDTDLPAPVPGDDGNRSEELRWSEARSRVTGEADRVGNQAQPSLHGMGKDTGDTGTVVAMQPLSPSHLPRDRAEFMSMVARKCHGYLGSDLERLCREAALRRMTSTSAISNMSDPANGQRSGITESLGVYTGGVLMAEPVGVEDFWAALDVVRPASLVGYSLGTLGGDLGPQDMPTLPLVGCDSAMAELRSFLLIPLANPSLLRGLGLGIAGGALLHGPPGCGKTSVARALAAEVKGVANFIEVRCSDLVDKVVGRSERSVSELFAAARAAAPCVLFLDQVEGVAARRGYHSSTEQTFDRILSTLLVEMDGVISDSSEHVVVLAATNDISRLDPALLRPGRLDRRVYLGPPDFHARKAILTQRLSLMPLEHGTYDLGLGATCVDEGGDRWASSHESRRGEEPAGSSMRRSLRNAEDYATWLANRTEFFSGARVVGICREAALTALREDLRAGAVAPRHFNTVLRSSRRGRSVAED